MDAAYSDDAVTLYCADALEVLRSLPDDSVDLLCTDPPYNVSERNGRDHTTVGRLKRKDGTARKVWRDFGEWDRGFDPAAFLDETRRVLREGGSLLAFTSEFTLPAYLDSGLNHRCLIYWRKTNPTPAFRQLYVRAVEMIVWQVKTDKPRSESWTFNAGGYRPNVYEGPVLAGHLVTNNDEARVHPTQKPLWLMRTLVEMHSRPGDVVVDPFMGSGTTIAAAKSLGRRVIGTDTISKYVEHAASRCRQEVLGLSA